MTEIVKILVSAKTGFSGVINQVSVVGGRDYVFISKDDPSMIQQLTLGTRQKLDLDFPERANDADFKAFVVANELTQATALEKAKAYLASLTKKAPAKTAE